MRPNNARVRALSALLCLHAAFYTAPAYGAFGATAVFEVSVTGAAANANGGGFDPSVPPNTDLVCATATSATVTCTSATYTFVTADVTPVPGAGTSGAWLAIITTSTWNNANASLIWCEYPIVSASAGTVTINAAIGAGNCRDSSKGYPIGLFGPTTFQGVNTSASPTGGSWLLDYSHGDIAAFAAADLIAVTTTTLTSASFPFGANHLGNAIHLTTGATTPGWYAITAVNIGTVTATIDRSCGGTAINITYKTGGAVGLNSTTANQTDNSFFSGAHMAPGSRVFMRSGAFTGALAITLAAGSANLPFVIEGYSTVRGDAPTGSTRPSLNMQTFQMTGATTDHIYYLSMTSSAANTYLTSTSAVIVGSKIVNNSTTAARTAVGVNGTNWHLFKNEFISYRGPAVSVGANSGSMEANYAHDSNIAVTDSATSQSRFYKNNLFESNTANCIILTAASTGIVEITGNTCYGSANKTGTGVSFATGTTVVKLTNNIISGFVTGITHADAAQQSGFSDYNDLFNNTTATTNWPTGSHSVAIDPLFTSVSQVTGTGATSATTTLTDAGAAFNGKVVDNQDFVLFTAATTAATGQYLITSHTNTTLVLSPSPGTGTAISYQVTYGRNFLPTDPTVKAGGYPGTFPASLTTGYIPIGAAGPVAGGPTINAIGN